ncbi:protein FAN-like isoform X2 [Photinus pyralis]|uniref:protein FAN-like isoform X2 n=1 Tax=Photinus pyralis TaxID=7054 RepID=UPI001267126E|nr:protein FAN-like isoform X2 [Photinus pyralis]
MEKGRFSLLVLEPGEIYFEDFSACLIPSDTTTSNYELKKQQGRLRMCSKSLVFEPHDLNKPLIKIPLKECTILEQFKGKAKFLNKSKNVLSVSTKLYIEMFEGNIIEPYKFCGFSRFLFLLNYANIMDCLPRITQLQRASTLPAGEQADMIATIVHSRQARVRFDPLWLDLYEKVVMETQADKVTPLVLNPGRILLSSARLFFQPYNNIETYPVLKINLSSIRQIIKRRFLLRHIGLEIYSSENNTIPYIYFAFRSPADRDKLYDNLLQQSDLKLSKIEQDVMTLQWQNGYVSNYDYLLYINSLADRTINDLTQYPVFPWVVADYKSKTLDLNNPETYRDLSKPIGALNADRLQKLMERFEEMSFPKFIYGSHYSTPAFVLFYLVRFYPHYVLCLQNGRFDHPDRMFNSCEDVYRNCLTNMSDFKELIPEFYDVEQGGEFLVNSMGINLGVRFDGSKVGDVQLPPWANSPKHFIRALRDALESDYVSERLHLWIDLIFGFKQRGDEAEEAKNLFYYLCYEGSVDLDSIGDLNKRRALEVQIMEFGQIPKQLFKVPHPQRKVKGPMLRVPSVDKESEKVNEDSTSVWKSVTSLNLESTFNTHKDSVSALLITDDNNQIMSVGYDGKFKVFSISQKRQIRSANIGNMPLSSIIQLPNTNVVVIGSFDNNIVLYDLDFGKVIQTVMAHEDSVTCLAWGNELKLLASGSSDCTVKIWRSFANSDVIKPMQCLESQLDHNSQLTCLCFRITVC